MTRNKIQKEPLISSTSIRRMALMPEKNDKIELRAQPKWSPSAQNNERTFDSFTNAIHMKEK